MIDPWLAFQLEKKRLRHWHKADVPVILGGPHFVSAAIGSFQATVGTILAM
jgi:hypothetical protein